MYVLSYALEINPDGASPKLTAQQVWKGLEMKAANALPFVPGMIRCDVVERKGDTLLRDITVPGGDFQERITFFAPVQVQFERVGSDGFIQNTISESRNGLYLTFTFGIAFPNAPAGSPEEQREGERMRDSYISAVEATLKRVRELAAAGAL